MFCVCKDCKALGESLSKRGTDRAWRASELLCYKPLEPETELTFTEANLWVHGMLACLYFPRKPAQKPRRVSQGLGGFRALQGVSGNRRAARCHRTSNLGLSRNSQWH